MQTLARDNTALPFQLGFTFLYADLQGKRVRWWVKEFRAIFLIKWELKHFRFRQLKWFTWNTAADLAEVGIGPSNPLLPDLTNANDLHLTRDCYALFSGGFTIASQQRLALSNFQLFWYCFNSSQQQHCFMWTTGHTGDQTLHVLLKCGWKHLSVLSPKERTF